MSVVELTGIEAKLTKAVEGGLVVPNVVPSVLKDVSSLATVGVKVEVTIPTNELVSSESFDGLDGFLDFHDRFLLI